MKFIANVLVKIEVEADTEEFAKELLEESNHKLFMDISGCEVSKGCYSLESVGQRVMNITQSKMLKFKVGDEVTVDNIKIMFDDSEGEARFIGAVGVIIEVVEGVSNPYQIKFYDKEIQKVNENMGSRLFKESELFFL